MTYANAIVGKVENEPSECGRDDFWTFAAVEERLIEAMDLWRRSPGEGRWPFASDAPWQWMTRRTRISTANYKEGRELQLHMQAEDAELTRRMEAGDRRGPLSRDEVALRDETTEWLGWVAMDARKVVIEALKQKLAGRSNVDWRRVRAAIGTEVTRQGLYKRYSTAISAIAKRLNGDSPAKNG